MAARHASPAPSAWVLRFCGLIRPGGAVLDLACGEGRHVRCMRDRGHPVVALDRDAESLARLGVLDGVETICADLEAGPWPLSGRSFDAIVVTNYLFRPLFGTIRSALNPDGVLIYETFMAGHERYGRPSNPDFLLRRDELLREAPPLQIVAFEQGFRAVPGPAVVQRLCAVRSDAPAAIG